MNQYKAYHKLNNRIHNIARRTEAKWSKEFCFGYSQYKVRHGIRQKQTDEEVYDKVAVHLGYLLLIRRNKLRPYCHFYFNLVQVSVLYKKPI